ncbi:unnamed protein product [Tilletia caries]|nr:unnamed protein product [Tilletia caries]
MSSLPTSPNRPGAAPLQTLPRSPLGPVTNVSQRFAELDRALDQAQEDNQEIFSQDDQLQDSSLPGTAPSPLLKKRADPKPASTAALKAKKGKAKSTSAEGSSSKDANKLIELGINVALAAPSTNAKGKAVKGSAYRATTLSA